MSVYKNRGILEIGGNAATIPGMLEFLRNTKLEEEMVDRVPVDQ